MAFLFSARKSFPSYSPPATMKKGLKMLSSQSFSFFAPKSKICPPIFKGKTSLEGTKSAK